MSHFTTVGLFWRIYTGLFSRIYMVFTYVTFHNCNTLQHTATHCNTLQHAAPDNHTMCEKRRTFAKRELITFVKRELFLFWRVLWLFRRCSLNAIIMYPWKETYIFEKRPTYLKRDLHIWKETYIFEKRPTYLKRDLHISFLLFTHVGL